jgi:hypothetical protein
MAIVVGDIVAVTSSSAALPYADGFCICDAEGPLFGSVTVYAAPAVTVLWGNGAYTATTIPNTSIDKILAPSAAGAALIGHVVAVTGQSASGRMNVVKAYKRNPTGTGTDIEVVLCQNVNGGAWREYLTSAVTLVQ